MNIEDVLHFYIGQQVETNRGIGKMISINHIGECTVELSVDDEDDFYLERVKPILRRLPSMTEEEANAWFDFHYRDNGVFAWRNCFEVNRAGAEYWINYHSSKRDRRHVIKFDQLNVHDFQWLLSKGFDLFNLIDSNLAIDRDAKS